LTNMTTVIQGTVDADTNGRLTRSDISKTIEFCFKAFSQISPQEKDALIAKLKSYGLDGQSGDEETQKAITEIEKNLTQEELQVLTVLRSRRMLSEDIFNLESFTIDTIDGLAPKAELGKLGLKKAKAAKLNKSSLFSTNYLEGKTLAGLRATEPKDAPKEAMNDSTRPA
jgi:flavine halogenase